jgi:hypothetical protein
MLVAAIDKQSLLSIATSSNSVAVSSGKLSHTLQPHLEEETVPGGHQHEWDTGSASRLSRRTFFVGRAARAAKPAFDLVQNQRSMSMGEIQPRMIGHHHGAFLPGLLRRTLNPAPHRGLGPPKGRSALSETFC